MYNHFVLWETLGFPESSYDQHEIHVKVPWQVLKKEARMSQTRQTALYTSQAASEFQNRRQPQCVLKVLSQKLIHNLHNAY